MAPARCTASTITPPMDTTTAWLFMTRWGNSLLLLPAASWICVSLWAGGDRRIAWRWALLFGGAVAVVLATKLAFLGWGVGIRSLDFTGVSGHSTLAASVLPMLAWWLTQDQAPATQRRAVGAGWGLAMMVGLSRVLLSTHSVSEVVAGLLLGSLVAWAVIPRGVVAANRTAFRWALLGALLIAGILTSVGESDGAHGFVMQLALQWSGRSEPFTRSML